MGLVTIRDLLGINQPEQTRIDSFWKVTGTMSPNDRIIELIQAMFQHNVRAMPVSQGKDVIGIISQSDVTEEMCKVTDFLGFKAKKLMHSPVISLEVNERVVQARSLMLEKDISHIPLVENNKLVGVVTAENIVHNFITTATKTTVGDRIGEKINRFPGLVGGIMDPDPFVIEPDASLLDVVCGFRDTRKSACIMINEQKSILGILTPREIISLLHKMKIEDDLPVYIIGLEDENFYERAIAEEKVRRVLYRSIKMHPDLTEGSIRIKRQKVRGNRTRYELTARAMGPEKQFNAIGDGWDLLETFDEVCVTLDKILRKSKVEPERSSRRRRFRRK